MAHSGHRLLHCTCPLSGVKRTCPFALHMSAYDPKRTCPTGLIQISAQLDQVSRFSFRRDAMTIYISRGRFTSDAVKGMVAKPENREEAVSKLCESVGGRLIG